MKVTIVIPSWNAAEFIGKCLDSLEKQSLKAEVVVVDNGSVDDSVKIIQRDYPKVHLIKLSKNRGFAGGVNAGIRYALDQGADAVALFNNDAEADRNWLKNLAKVLTQNEKAGIVTGKLMREDKKHFDSVGEEYSIWGMPFPRGRNQLDQGQFDKTEPVFAATGGASLYRAKMFKEIGLFDEKFFAYLEDVDISFRANLQGWEVWYEPSAVAYHHIGATSSKLGSFTRYHTIKNFIMLYKKNMPPGLFWKYWWLFNLYDVRLFISSTLRLHFWSNVKAHIRALLHMPAIYQDRRRIQKNREVTLKQIDSLLYHALPPKIPKI